MINEFIILLVVVFLSSGRPVSMSIEGPATAPCGLEQAAAVAKIIDERTGQGSQDGFNWQCIKITGPGAIVKPGI